MPKDNEFSKVIKVGYAMRYALCTNERGSILVTMLFIMIMITFVGLIAINTSSVDVQISGNMRRASSALEGAEAGVDLAVTIIEGTIAQGSLNPGGTTGIITGLDIANLGLEIMGGSDYNSDTPNSATPDVSISNLNSVGINVDIDRLYAYTIQGGALTFAAGYEGAGAGAGGGGIGILYSITSQGSI